LQLLTRTGLDWAEKYPTTIKALEAINAQQAYIDGELCAVDEMASRPSASCKPPRTIASPRH
jgi:ATP-dependent DNA ligase